jgi:RimJ/RimL family protein N-acetyltransferase
MSTDIFTGKLVRLVALDLENDAKMFSQWEQDSEFQRLWNSEVPQRYNPSQLKKYFEEEISRMHMFMIERLEDGRKIGEIDLSGFNWTVGNAWVGIGIGERELWGKGYGTDAMQVLLRYAFEELNLKRLTLNVFDVNQRGISSYEKAGFRHEGRIPGGLLIAGKRCDIVYMGILRREWEELQ